MKTALSRALRLHSEGMNAEIKATKSRFDERADVSARIVSLPFIRNHGFARNDIKGAVFRDFPAFLKAFLEMPKKKTVNLRLKNEILCLTFAFREQIRAMADAFSLTTAMRFLRSESEKLDGAQVPRSFSTLHRIR